MTSSFDPCTPGQLLRRTSALPQGQNDRARFQQNTLDAHLSLAWDLSYLPSIGHYPMLSFPSVHFYQRIVNQEPAGTSFISVGLLNTDFQKLKVQYRALGLITNVSLEVHRRLACSPHSDRHPKPPPLALLIAPTHQPLGSVHNSQRNTHRLTIFLYDTAISIYTTCCSGDAACSPLLACSYLDPILRSG